VFRGFLKLILGVCLLTVCACSKNEVGNETTTPAEMLSLYQSKLPIGTPVRVARELMLKEGFSVEEESRGKWKGRSGLRFLRCTRDDGKLVKRRWEFALMHDGVLISGVEMRAATVYP
jgi:hypothetical protein